MAAELHPRSGKLIGLSNSNRTARRNQPVQEFNHGLVLSKEPLRDRDVFTVRIDKKVNNNNRPVAAASLSGGESSGSSGAGTGRWSVSVRSEGLLLPGAAHTADSDHGWCSCLWVDCRDCHRFSRDMLTYQTHFLCADMLNSSVS